MADSEETHDAPPAEEPKHEEPKHEEHHEPPRDDHAECRGRHMAHEERIKGLEDALQAALQFKTDSTPVRKPWTHRG